jgi:hypothetical protein
MSLGSRAAIVIIGGAALAVLAGCELPPETLERPDAGTGPGDPSYAFVVLPDTQYYSSSWPEIFQSQTQWIVDHRAAEKIAFVLHTGDIVDTDIAVQWGPASAGLHTLDGQVPYALTAGNHDYNGGLADRMGLVNTYFPPSHFAQYPWFGGTFEPGHVENNFNLFPAGPGGSGRWLVLALEFGPRNEVLAWANDVLKAFRTTPAIIITHAYLYRDGTRYDFVGSGDSQDYNPHRYVMMGQASSSVNDGQEIWDKLIAGNRNVKLVFSGHDVGLDDLPPGTTARLSSTRADGSVVHQILANYQTCLGPPCEFPDSGVSNNVVRGGNGYLRVVRVTPGVGTAAGTIAVSTYSPYVDRSLSDDGNQFTLPLN